MYKTLSPHAIGVKANTLEEGIAAAQAGDFLGIEVHPAELARRVHEHGARNVIDLYANARIRPAAIPLLLDWRGDAEPWKAGLNDLPGWAEAAAAVGVTRSMTWIAPSSDERSFDENLAFHIERFTPIAAILNENGISLGLEFIGPKTLRDNVKYEFIHTMPAMLAMAAEIGPNVGLLLDCWHWYTSHATVEDLNALRPEQVVYVHVNDAPPGIPIDEQNDHTRALPGETGVIDIAGFLGALRRIGYEGPITPEPFKKSLADLPSDAERLRVVGVAMDRILGAPSP